MKRMLRHADDLGISPGVTERIFAACDAGAIDSVSLVPNGLAFDSAVRGLLARPGIIVSLHLNLVEGRPVCSPGEVPALVDSDGYFRHTFGSLWASHFSSGPLGRQCLASQVRLELTRQILRAKKALGKRCLRVDSHQHYHLLPFVLDEILRVGPELGVKYVRTAREPWHWVPGLSPRDWLVGYARRALLGALSSRAARRIRACGLETNRWLLGVAASGKMERRAAEAALAAAARRGGASDIEILFHPGGGERGEERIWSEKYARFLGHYFSPWRRREALCAAELQVRGTSE